MSRRSLLSVSQTVDEFEVFASNFNTLDGITLNEANGTVTSSNIIGTVTPNTPKALTIDWTSVGSTTASIDLGQAYDELYVQYYVSIINPSSASNYSNNLEVGSSVEANHAAQVLMKHASGQWTIFSQDGSGFHSLGRVTNAGSWNKIGMHFSGNTVEYFVNDRLAGTFNTFSQDRRYVTIGGTAAFVSGYKSQYASLTVNTDHFQDIITNSNGVGSYTSHFVDYSSTYNTDYNGVDLSAIDKSGWSGLHSEPFDPNGGTNYIDGASPYLSQIGESNALARREDKFFLRRGVTHRMKDINSPHKINGGTGGYSATVYPTLSAYDTGNDPVLAVSTPLDSSAWSVFDAPNGIYRQAISNPSSRVTGVFIGDEYALRVGQNLTTIETYSGVCYATTTHIYVRMYDDGDPSLEPLNISSNIPVQINDYGLIKNTRFIHGLVKSPINGVLELSKFAYGAGTDTIESITRDCVYTDLWTGTDYYRTEVNNIGLGLRGSGNGGRSVGAYSKFYRNIVEDGYLGVLLFPNSNNSLIAFNQFKNTRVNTLNISGAGATNPITEPIRFWNNTVFASPGHRLNPEYPVSRDQPGHGFVHQNGAGSYFEFVNNLMLLHYNANSTPTATVMNLMSFTSQALTNAHGKIGYNKYFKTPISTSPAVIFNLGLDDITAWRTQLAAAGDFTDVDGTSNPDITSSVVTTLPVTTGNYTATSGEWLETDGTPTVTGGGYDLDYASEGITTDLSGNTITSTKNIGAW